MPETLHPQKLIEQIPDPDTVRSWLADTIRNAALLRSLLRVSVRKASFSKNDVRKEASDVE